MLYNEKQIRRIINNAVTTAGIDSAVVNGNPVGVLDEYTDFTRYGNVLLQPSVANTFINSLYNQFIYRATRENFFTSPFDRFRERREGVGYGEYETDVQPILPVPYDMKAFDRILDFWETPVITQYFYINRRDTFPQTIVKEMLKDAFKSYDDFDNFLAKLIMAPRKGNVIIETNAVKQVINLNIANGAVKTRAIGDLASADEDFYKNLASEIVGTAMAMSAEPSKDFNNYGRIQGADGDVWTQSDRRDLVLIGKSSLIAKLKTYVLAFAFNKEEVDFDFSFVTVNDFDYASYDGDTRTFGEKLASPVELILCDGGWIKLEDNLDEEFSNTNAMTMGVQRALQVQQTIGIRAYRNAIAWLDGEDTAMNEALKILTDQSVFYPLSAPDLNTEIDPNTILIPINDVKSLEGYDAETQSFTFEATATIGELGGTQTPYTLPTFGTDYDIFGQPRSEVYTKADNMIAFTVADPTAFEGTAPNQVVTITVKTSGQQFVVIVPATYSE